MPFARFNAHSRQRLSPESPRRRWDGPRAHRDPTANCQFSPQISTVDWIVYAFQEPSVSEALTVEYSTTSPANTAGNRPRSPSLHRKSKTQTQTQTQRSKNCFRTCLLLNQLNMPEMDASWSKPLTKMEYDDFLSEIESVTGQLTKTRTALWSTQDRLGHSEEKIQQLEMHIDELVASREEDAKEIKGLQEENTRCLEEEMKIRDSLELMKKVFTRTQLKSKEEHETITLLQEERDLLLEENQKLRSSYKLGTAQTNDADKNASVLATALEQTRSELAEYKRKHNSAENTIRMLKKKLLDDTNMNAKETDRKLQKQRKVIDRLENQIMELVDDDDTRGDYDVYDDYETDIISRAFFDEDLEGGLARSLMQRLDCTSFNEAYIPGSAYLYSVSGVKSCGSM